MGNYLDDYQSAINNKDIELIKQLNKKYFFNEKNYIFYKLFEEGRLNYKSLKYVLFISLEDPTTFKFTSDFLDILIEKEDIKSLQLILNNYIYKNDLIKMI